MFPYSVWAKSQLLSQNPIFLPLEHATRHTSVLGTTVGSYSSGHSFYLEICWYWVWEFKPVISVVEETEAGTSQVQGLPGLH